MWVKRQLGVGILGVTAAWCLPTEQQTPVPGGEPGAWTHDTWCYGYPGPWECDWDSPHSPSAGDSPVTGEDGKHRSSSPLLSSLKPQTDSPSVFLVFGPGTEERADDTDCKGGGLSACADAAWGPVPSWRKGGCWKV